MIKRSKARALAAICAVVGACAFGSDMIPPTPGGHDLEPALASHGVVSDQGNGWFVLDTGFGYEGFPILYRVDGGVLCAFSAFP